MKLEIKDFCIRCGMCEDIYPKLFKFNLEDDIIEILVDEIPPDCEDMAKAAIKDCAIAAIHIVR